MEVASSTSKASTYSAVASFPSRLTRCGVVRDRVGGSTRHYNLWVFEEMNELLGKEWLGE